MCFFFRRFVKSVFFSRIFAVKKEAADGRRRLGPRSTSAYRGCWWNATGPGTLCWPRRMSGTWNTPTGPAPSAQHRNGINDSLSLSLSLSLRFLFSLFSVLSPDICQKNKTKEGRQIMKTIAKATRVAIGRCGRTVPGPVWRSRDATEVSMISLFFLIVQEQHCHLLVFLIRYPCLFVVVFSSFSIESNISSSFTFKLAREWKYSPIIFWISSILRNLIFFNFVSITIVFFRAIWRAPVEISFFFLAFFAAHKWTPLISPSFF